MYLALSSHIEGQVLQNDLLSLEKWEKVWDMNRKLVEAPSNFIAGRPKAPLLFWFFGGFRCGVPLFIVMLVIF